MSLSRHQMHLTLTFEKLNIKSLIFRSPADSVDNKIIYSVCCFRQCNTVYCEALVTTSPSNKPACIYGAQFPSLPYKQENSYRGEPSGVNDAWENLRLFSDLLVSVLKEGSLLRDQKTHLYDRVIWHELRWAHSNNVIKKFTLDTGFQRRFCISLPEFLSNREDDDRVWNTLLLFQGSTKSMNFYISIF